MLLLNTAPNDGVLPPAPCIQDRMDRSKEVTPADVTGGALDKSDPVAGAGAGAALLLWMYSWLFACCCAVA